jgi:hypothetical protein
MARKTATDFKKLAKEKGFKQNGQLLKTLKATKIRNWFKEEFDFGHGHSMAIYATFKGKKE